MKSKYSPLVTVKQKALDLAEAALIKANNEVEVSTAALEEAYLLLSNIKLPTKGALSEFTQVQLMIQTQHREIEACRTRMENARNKQLYMRNEYTKAQIEFEKFSYLEIEEINRHRAKIKKEEAKMLDEIGTMMYKKGLE